MYNLKEALKLMLEGKRMVPTTGYSKDSYFSYSDSRRVFIFNNPASPITPSMVEAWKCNDWVEFTEAKEKRWQWIMYRGESVMMSSTFYASEQDLLNASIPKDYTKLERADWTEIEV